MHALEPWLSWLPPIGLVAGLFLGGLVFAQELRTWRGGPGDDPEAATGRPMLMLVSLGIVVLSLLGLIFFAIGHS